MEKFVLNRDITVLYVTARSFPEGIKDAFDELYRRMPFKEGMDYFGISRPEPSENGGIVYRAAIEETEKGQASRLGCDTLVLHKGNYISLEVSDFKQEPMKISKAFEELLEQPNLDPLGYCVEWYTTDGDSVRCMIRLDQ